MAYSTQRATSDGTLVLLSLSIDYFDRAEISVFFDGLLHLESDSTWNWVGTTDTAIAFTPAVPVGVEIMLQRNTVLDAPLHEYTKGAQFIAETLDDNFNQCLRIVQEAREGSGATDQFSDLDFHGFKIKNVGLATDPTDVVSLAQYQADAAGASASKVAAAASAAAALASEVAAEADRIAAAASAAAALVSENAASASEAAALGYKNTAGTSASTATSQAVISTAQADVAIAQAGSATASAVAAATSYDAFDDRFLGAKASAPTLDNDGNALLTGALYFNSTSNTMFVRTSGAAWQALTVATATGVSNTPAGGIAATDVQSALNELDGEKANLSTTGLLNRIINGACNVQQRAALVCSNNIGGYGSVDRFYAVNGNAGGQFTVSAGSFTYAGVVRPSVKHTVNTVVADLSGVKYWTGIGQLIEGVNCYDLNKSEFTISLLVQASVAGTYSIAVRNGTLTTTYVTNVTLSAGVAQRVVVKVPAYASGLGSAADGTAGINVWVGGQSSGTYQTATLNAWQAGAFIAGTGHSPWGLTGGATLEVAELQLVQGASDIPFERRLHSHEFTLCQRYLYRPGALDTGRWGGATSVRIYYPLPAPMRATPTVALLTPVLSIEQAQVVNHTCTNATISGSGISSLRAFVELTATWTGTPVAGAIAQANVAGYMSFDAELT